ncbi:MAG: hypothetical protein HYR94_19570, partial [Chloroflexi bacterium]|nr:hypothetical protein [Chloroflexota bacterium]
MPERHRSLRAVFEQTWQRLPEAEQVVLSKLSVFKGGCTRQAAEAVTGASLPALAALMDKALLRQVQPDAVGEYTRAERLIKAALQTREELQDKVGIAYSCLDLGKLTTMHGAYEEARKQIERGLRICQE